MADDKPISVFSVDDVRHEFPAGTDQTVIDKAMKDYAEERRDKSTSLGQIGEGMVDPLAGGGELISDLLPKFVTRQLDLINNKLSKATGGIVPELPEGGKPEAVRQREAEIAKRRGSNTGMDWPRMAGNILSPVNWLGTGIGPEIKGATFLEKLIPAMERGEIAGGTSAAMQPTTSQNRGFEKAVQLVEGTGLGAITSFLGGAAGKGFEKVGEFIARNYPENLLSTAVQTVMRRIGQDEKAGGLSASQAIDAVNAAHGPWGINPDAKPMTLADVGGPGVKGLAGNVARPPGQAKSNIQNFLNKRDEGAAKRLSDDIDRYVNGGPTMHQATEMLLQQRSAEARPLYKEAHALKGVWSPLLEQFLQDPVIKTGLARGYELERLYALAEGRNLNSHDMGVALGADGSVTLFQKPNMLLLDMGKQGLDAMIADERNEITGRLTKRGLALENVRKAYLNELDALDPTGTYAKARASWAGHSQSLDSMRLGRTIFERSPEENAKEVSKLSPANREFMRIGAADLLRERLLKSGLKADEAKQLLKNQWMRGQLRPIFASADDFDAFVDSVSKETQMFETGAKMLGGSQTAERLAEDASPEQKLGEKFVERAMHSGVIPAILDSATNAYKMYRDLGLSHNPELNEKIAKILFSTRIEPSIADLMRSRRPLPARNDMLGAAQMAPGFGVGMAPPLAVDLTKERSPQQ